MRNEIITKVKQVIEQGFHDAEYGIFFTRNIFNDPMETVYEDDKIQIDICYVYGYFEIFGLTNDEQEEIESYYYKRLKRRHA